MIEQRPLDALIPDQIVVVLRNDAPLRGQVIPGEAKRRRGNAQPLGSLHGGNAVTAVNVGAVEDKRRPRALKMLEEGFCRPKGATGGPLQAIKEF